ncbi:MAG: metalloregulator ArsR/SmtB family transcription factor [Nitrosopumilus sp.]|nr:metalloregulator ArsR/SmtB family transcription factor [Nitrosopumilus sp.]MDH3736356.1 metalloregulator ArsR/SmtB family transcription factor [Nitrosopumilus sp.]MDH3822327.1 metalloregulator ArsR/SmtB family transcription factor [Nitrosopumilus sp.]MDH3834296.1 metalloregulator ArsR/SmtB family transcription factor [Nitrosopumilus sp.]
MKQKVDQFELKAKLFRGFGDVTRLSILESISEEEKTVTKISEELDQSQSNVSNHLSCLSECGLVKSRKDGKNRFYSIGDKRVVKLLKQGDDILSDIAEGIYSCVNYKK